MAKINTRHTKAVNDFLERWGPWSNSRLARRRATKAMKPDLDLKKHEAIVNGRATRSAETKAKIDSIKNANKVSTSGNSTSNSITSNKQGGSTTPQNNASANNSSNPSSNQANAKTNTGNQTTAATTAVAQNASKSNPFYKSVSSWVKDNPKTSYSAIASLFAAPILYSMFGDSEDTPSDAVPKGTNADTNNYKLLANKAKQDINKEYAAARNRTTGTNKGTYTQSATQNADNNLKQLNELDARIDASMGKLKALEAEALRRIQEKQANQKSPQNPQLGSVWDTGSGDIGIFNASYNNYTPILPSNPILPHTAIDINNGTNNLAENVINTSVGQNITQGAATPEKKETPATGTNKGINNAVNENTQSSITPDYLTEFYKKFDKKYNYNPAKGRFNIWL